VIVPPYPLTWPAGQERTLPSRRQKSPFRTTFAAAIQNATDSLRRFGNDAGFRITDTILSTNYHFMDKAPADPGAVLWFRMDGDTIAFGVDRFERLDANVQAIHHIIEARRTELRYGGLTLVRRTFTAFRALPAPAGARDCWEVLGIKPGSPSVEIERAWAALAKKHHPDKPGGDAALMAEINRARDEAQRAIA